jgi:DNA-binding response OmpR family regulator
MSATTTASLRILVVDDNQDGADTMAWLVRFWGHEVRIANDGRAGVEEASLFHPDLILMDIGLPLLNGFEAAKQVRAALGRTVTLVALTAYSSDVARAEGREAGFDYYLVKPAQPSGLQEIFSETAEHKLQTERPFDTC